MAKDRFAVAIQNARIDAGFTSAREAADALGLSLNSYNNYEQGRAFPTPERMIDLASLFHCSIDELYAYHSDGRDETIRLDRRTRSLMKLAQEGSPDDADDEADLIRCYRTCTARGRKAISLIARTLGPRKGRTRIVAVYSALTDALSEVTGEAQD